MKAKLIKTIDEQGVMYSLSGDNLPENYVLSDKNCQSIERGFDLDELADEYCNKIPFTLYEQEIFKDGFQKAVELMGDKKFSDDQLKQSLWGLGHVLFHNCQNGFAEGEPQKYIDSIIQSLQQTEWDVEILEIENDEVYSVSENMKVAHNKAFDGVLFKYDADGCLILKRK